VTEHDNKIAEEESKNNFRFSKKHTKDMASYPNPNHNKRQKTGSLRAPFGFSWQRAINAVTSSAVTNFNSGMNVGNFFLLLFICFVLLSLTHIVIVFCFLRLFC
jgi:hypothetical protein